MNDSLEDHSEEEIFSSQIKRKIIEETNKCLTKRRKSGVSVKKEVKVGSGKNAKNNSKFCEKCDKKLRLMCEFTCRCGGVFCAMHRFHDQHGCTFDYRKEAMAKLEKMNPKIVNDKITRL